MESREIDGGIFTGVKESSANTTITLLGKSCCSCNYKQGCEEYVLKTTHAYDRINLYVAFLNKGGQGT